jgi:hypothetical protein
MTALLNDAVDEDGVLKSRLDPKELQQITEWVDKLGVNVLQDLGDPEEDPAAKRAAQLSAQLSKR